jgi:hypothetical protein
MNPITSISPASHVFLPLSQTGRAKTFTDPLADIPPFWRQLNERLSATAGDMDKFRMLTDLAQRAGSLPSTGPWLPPLVELKLHGDDILEWAREQQPGVRGRLYRLMLGANVAALWPYYLLQNEGRFDPRWQKAMSSAAARYVQTLRADAQAVALLKQDLAALPRQDRRRLTVRMVEHAAAALEIPSPEVRVFDKANAGRDDKDNDKDAVTVFENPVRIHFYPGAFEHGNINLIVTVFHEAVHAEQMNLMRAEQVAGIGDASPLGADDAGRAAVLELSMMHLHAISEKRRGDHQYYLYRYATEAEREAHVAELAVAMLAAECPEFNPGKSGTLRKIRASAAGTPHDPNAMAAAYIKQETGFDPEHVSACAAKAASTAQAAGPTLHVLAALGNRRLPIARAMMRAVARDAFEATASRLAHRHDSLPLPMQPAPVADTAPAQAAAVWAGLLKLEQLRDPLDTSDMLAHALLSAAPRLFYGRSDECGFLRTVIVAALGVSRPPLVQVVRRHLEQRFGCKFTASPSPAQFENTVTALRRAWFAYRSDLSRRIVFESACRAMLLDDTGRRALRRALYRHGK